MDAITNNNIRLVSRRKRDATLSEYVRLSVKNYFSRLNGSPSNGLYVMVIHEVEKPLIEAVLDETNRNQSKASQALGISRSTLRKKIIQYDIH